jgi:hypothetical protein
MNKATRFPAASSAFGGTTAGAAPSPVAAPVTPIGAGIETPRGSPTEAAGAPNRLTPSKLPDCTECGRGFYLCTCHVAEPDVMPVEQMMEVMPGFFERPRDGSIWLASEEAAVRSAFGMVRS